MSKFLFAAAVLLAACATEVAPSPPSVDPEVAATGAVEGTAAPALFGSFEITPDSCDDHSELFTAHPAYSDGSSTLNVRCQYQFVDALVDSCNVKHSIPDLQPVVLMMRDDATGASATSQDLVIGPASFTASVDVTTSLNTLTWHAHTAYGDEQDAGDVAISITPAANVVVEDPAIFAQRDGTVQVTAAGTYTVTVAASYLFTQNVGGCETTATGSVDVSCD